MNSNFYLHQQKLLATSAWYRQFWKFWGIYSVLLIFAVGGYLLLLGKWREVLAAFAAFVLARVVVSPLIYIFYKRQRPYQKLNFTTIHSWLLSGPATRHNSFPSDHAASFASISTALFWYFPVLGVFLILLTLINGCGRIVLGYHYSFHVLAGWIVGVLSALAVVYWLAPVLFTH